MVDDYLPIPVDGQSGAWTISSQKTYAGFEARRVLSGRRTRRPQIAGMINKRTRFFNLERPSLALGSDNTHANLSGQIWLMHNT